MPVSSFPVWFVLQDDGPTARDLLVQYATGKKGSKNKKKLEKAMKVLKVRCAPGRVAAMVRVWVCVRGRKRLHSRGLH